MAGPGQILPQERTWAQTKGEPSCLPGAILEDLGGKSIPLNTEACGHD